MSPEDCWKPREQSLSSPVGLSPLPAGGCSHAWCLLLCAFALCPSQMGKGTIWETLFCPTLGTPGVLGRVKVLISPAAKQPERLFKSVLLKFDPRTLPVLQEAPFRKGTW